MLDDMRERREEQRASKKSKSRSKGGGGGCSRVETPAEREARGARNRKSCMVFLLCACIMCSILAAIIALVFVFVVNAE